MIDPMVKLPTDLIRPALRVECRVCEGKGRTVDPFIIVMLGLAGAKSPEDARNIAKDMGLPEDKCPACGGTGWGVEEQ